MKRKRKEIKACPPPYKKTGNLKINWSKVLYAQEIIIPGQSNMVRLWFSSDMWLDIQRELDEIQLNIVAKQVLGL